MRSFYRATTWIQNWPVTPLEQESLRLSSPCVADKGCFEDDPLCFSASHLQCVFAPFYTPTILSSCICHPNLHLDILQFSPCSSSEAVHPMSLHLEFIAPVTASTENGDIPYRKPGKAEVLRCLETPTGSSVPHK